MEREARRQQRAAAREHAATQRRAEQACKEEERLRQQEIRADAADRKRLEKEAKAAHVRSREAEVDDMNAALAEIIDEIDSILAATLDVDDFVDLEALRQTSDHPPFDRKDLEVPNAKPVFDSPAEPELLLPEPPTGIFAMKKRYEKKAAAAREKHEIACASWKKELEAAKQNHQEAMRRHGKAEGVRLEMLRVERERYDKECAARDLEMAECNREIDELIANLGYGTAEAIQEYISIVVSNSIYPEHFPVEHSFEFEPSTAELKMRVEVPPPSAIPVVKEYKYKKSSDEIGSSSLSQKVLKDRYAGAVHQVAVRTFHEVFEADRRGLIKTISLEVGTTETDPATGIASVIPFVAVASARDVFMTFDLSAVIPEATLKHLGASLSKNTYGLAPAKIDGIRKS